MRLKQRVKAAWAALTGQSGASCTIQLASVPAPQPQPQPPSPPSELERELARLRLDLQRRDAEAATLRAEFSRQEGQAVSATAAAGREALAELCRALAPTLSQLATLRHMAESGREVRAGDALKLCGKVEQALLERGLARIGEVGAASPFDPSLHQRMSGGDVRDGDQVRVRFVGYRFANGAPVKALVSRIPETSATSGAPEETL